MSNSATTSDDCIYSAQILELSGCPPDSLIELSLHFVAEHEHHHHRQQQQGLITSTSTTSTSTSLVTAGHSTLWSADSEGRVAPPAAEHQQHQHFYSTLLSGSVHRRDPDVRALRVTVSACRSRGAHDGLSSPVRLRDGNGDANAGADDEEKLVLCPVHDKEELEERRLRRMAVEAVEGEQNQQQKNEEEEEQKEEEEEEQHHPPASCICSVSLIDADAPPTATRSIGAVGQLFGAKWLELSSSANSNNDNNNNNNNQARMMMMRVRVAWSCSGIANRHPHGAVNFASADTPTHSYLHHTFQQHHAVHGSKTYACGALSASTSQDEFAPAPAPAAAEEEKKKEEDEDEDANKNNNNNEGAEENRDDSAAAIATARPDASFTSTVVAGGRGATQQQQQPPSSSSSPSKQQQQQEQQEQQQQVAATSENSLVAASATATITSSVSRLERVLTDFAKNFHARLSSLESRIDSMERKNAVLATHLSLEMSPPTVRQFAAPASTAEALEMLGATSPRVAYQQQQQEQEQQPMRSSDNNDGGQRSSVLQYAAQLQQHRHQQLSPAVASSNNHYNSEQQQQQQQQRPRVPWMSPFIAHQQELQEHRRRSSSSGRARYSSSSNNTNNINTLNNRFQKQQHQQQSAQLQQCVRRSNSGGGSQQRSTPMSVPHQQSRYSNGGGGNGHRDGSQQQQQQNGRFTKNHTKISPSNSMEEEEEERDEEEVDFSIVDAPKASATAAAAAALSPNKSNGSRNNNKNNNSSNTNGNGHGSPPSRRHSVQSAPISPPPRVVVANHVDAYDPKSNNQQRSLTVIAPANASSVPDSALRAIFESPTKISADDQARLAGYQPPPAGPFRNRNSWMRGGVDGQQQQEQEREASVSSSINALGANSGSGGASIGNRGGLLVGNNHLHPLNAVNRFVSRQVTSEEDELLDPVRSFPINSLARDM